MAVQRNFSWLQVKLLYIFALIILLTYGSGNVISIYLNAAFGHSRIGELGQVIAVLCDLFKIGLSVALIFTKDVKSRLLCIAGLLAFGALSVFSSYGYYIERLEHRTGTIRATQQHFQDLKTRQLDLTQKIKQLGQHRSIAEITQELKVLKRHRIYKDPKRSNGCQNATIRESELFCTRIGKLEVELIAAKQNLPIIAHLQTQLQSTRKRLKAINKNTVHQRADRFASSLGSADRVNLVFTLFLSVLIEIVTTSGFAVASIVFRAARRIQKIPVTETLIAQDVTLKDFKVFLSDCTKQDPNGSVLSKDLYTVFQNWCFKKCFLPVPHQNRVGELMTQLGYYRQRSRHRMAGKRPTGYRGLSLKHPVQEVEQRVVQDGTG